MSLLGFDRALRNLPAAEKRFLRDGMKEAQKEFKFNFDEQKNSESGEIWKPVIRRVPPPILNVTGRLKAGSIQAGRVQYFTGRAVLTVDPIDERGRGYAQYHQDGIGRNPQREFLTQSEELTRKQTELLYKIGDDIFE